MLPAMESSFDAVIVGAGAAGLFCAGVARQRGLRVLLLDHSAKVAEKIRISGGGRANFTNVEVGPRNFLSDNPHFCRGPLSRYTPQQFIGLLQRDGIPYHEKHKGQLFCDRSAEDLIDLLLRECEAGAAGGSVTRWQPCAVQQIRSVSGGDARYALDTDHGTVQARALVIATGGLSIPKIGATDFGYRVARQFGLRIVETRPALVPLTFDAGQWQPFAELAGLSLPVEISTGARRDKASFSEDLLFTHRGLSGPAVLQISSYWKPGTPLTLDLAPGADLHAALSQSKLASRKLLANVLGERLPSRLAATWAQRQPAWERPVNEVPDKQLAALADSLHGWSLQPTGTEGYRKAEVTAGGVDTRDLSSQTLESTQPGLYFIGEVVDVTGWLGGYNFQWAWASAYTCAQALAAH
jgi:predicted Rossmann fold flavoprotein